MVILWILSYKRTPLLIFNEVDQTRQQGVLHLRTGKRVKFLHVVGFTGLLSRNPHLFSVSGAVDAVPVATQGSTLSNFIYKQNYSKQIG